VQQRAPEGAGPCRDIFGVHAAKPVDQNLRVAEVGPPPQIKILAGNRQLREPGRNRNSALLQLIERASKSIAALRDLMQRQCDRHQQNQAGQKCKQQWRHDRRTAARDRNRAPDVDRPDRDGDHCRPGQCHQEIACDPGHQQHDQECNRDARHAARA
jgi:hypothetical protein